MKLSFWHWAATAACGVIVAVFAELGSRAGYADEADEAAAARQFESQIAPLLARHCLECHDAAAKQGGLDLSRQQTALAGGETGAAIVPGKLDESLLWAYVDSDEMPKDRPALSQDEKRLLRQWIEGGATWSLDVIDPARFAGDGRVAEIWIRRLTVPEYIETVRSAAGVDIERDARRLLPRDLRADGFTNTAYSLNVDLAHIEAYAALARIIAGRMDVPAFAAEHVASDGLQQKLRDAKGARLEESELRASIAGIGQWLLRGPLADPEVDTFLSIAAAVHEHGGDSAEALRYVLEAMLQSPRFIYRIEKQAGDGQPRRVDGYELASRLSYSLWGGPPDRELMRAAAAGELADRNRVEAQVRRMLEDPQAVKRSRQFIGEWMNLDRLATLRPNPEHFPNWSSELAADMREETLAFFEDIAWKRKRPLWELMNADVTYATPRLAAHYGLDRSLAATSKERPSHRSEAAADSPGAQASPRVSAGLLALYTFQEGRGERIRDVAEAGEPLHLKIADTSKVRWSASGLTVRSPNLIASERTPDRLLDAVRKSGAVTLEAWITPANTSQAGPARILTLSADPNQRNFTLGQEGDKFDVRFRTTKTSGNGQPSVTAPGGSARTGETHVVYTRGTDGKARLYIDGEERASQDVAGDLSNWDGKFRLALANELTQDRPWLGTLHLVAVYDRALAPAEVRQNHAAGGRPADAAKLAQARIANPRVTEDLEALYTFDEGSGNTVRDVSRAGEPLDLRIRKPEAVRWEPGRLTVNGSTLISTAGRAARLTQAIKRSKAVTIEAWVAPANASQGGPARIVTLSSSVVARNFTLGQEGDKYDVRFRTTKTDNSGLPSLSSPSGAVETRLTHLVYTRNRGGQAKLYIDGRERAARDVGQDISNWDVAFPLGLANEMSGDRPWLGAYFLVAIYSRALSADEVRQNHAAGALPEAAAQLAQAAMPVQRSDEGLEVLYAFEDGSGDTVRDTSGDGEPLNLTIDKTSAVKRETGRLTTDGSALIATSQPARRLTEAVKRSKAITLEAWITPGETNQTGPARILTLSSGTGERNFTLGQDGDRFDVRFRGGKTDANGGPSLSTPGGSVQTRLTHVVYTRDAAGQAKLYVDGQERAAREVEGDLTNWNSGYRLAIGNETSKDRPWRGTFHHIAIYSRALSPAEIRLDGGLARYDLASVPARGGLLTQGSVLTIGGDEASMVARGLFVLNDLLYSRVGNPPPCVDTTPVPTKPGMSQRAIAEARLADASCGGCHAKFEPLAFSLEKFDGTGAFHEVDDHGNKLREDGQILLPGEAAPVSYQTIGEFTDLLANSERVRMGITRKLTQFVIGRPLAPSDQPIVDRIHASAGENGGTYAALISAIVMSDLVQMTGTEAVAVESSE